MDVQFSLPLIPPTRAESVKQRDQVLVNEPWRVEGSSRGNSTQQSTCFFWTQWSFQQWIERLWLTKMIAEILSIYLGLSERYLLNNYVFRLKPISICFSVRTHAGICELVIFVVDSNERQRQKFEFLIRKESPPGCQFTPQWISKKICPRYLLFRTEKLIIYIGQVRITSESETTSSQHLFHFLHCPSQLLTTSPLIVRHCRFPQICVECFPITQVDFCLVSHVYLLPHQILRLFLAAHHFETRCITKVNPRVFDRSDSGFPSTKRVEKCVTPVSVPADQRR
jgi:hypothetical protein